MAEILVDSETRWKCLLCGECCKDVGKGLSIPEFDKKSGCCFNLNKENLCSDYANRLLICRMYPFHPSREKLALGIIDFSIGKLLIDSSCPGYGQGSKVVENEALAKEFDNVRSLFESRKDMIKNKKIVEVFFKR
ncbi:YkgJ family cysteine cluster protein [Candidatus Woesearchaeota archaeon]|nr:YkgJ family cysteine cluster protein [Candidatus Woesearchaeota archaeon]